MPHQVILNNHPFHKPYATSSGIKSGNPVPLKVGFSETQKPYGTRDLQRFRSGDLYLDSHGYQNEVKAAAF